LICYKERRKWKLSDFLKQFNEDMRAEFFVVDAKTDIFSEFRVEESSIKKVSTINFSQGSFELIATV
jgi:hypothetical protein